MTPVAANRPRTFIPLEGPRPGTEEEGMHLQGWWGIPGVMLQVTAAQVTGAPSGFEDRESLVGARFVKIP